MDSERRYKMPTRRKTNEYFIKEVGGLVGDEYTFLETYVNNRTHLEVKHNECGYTYKITPKDFLNGSRCRECSIKRRTINPNKYKEDFEDIMGTEFTLLSEYLKGRSPVKIRHEVCGNISSVRGSALYEGSIGCKVCADKTQTKPLKQFNKEVKEVLGNDYEVIGNYTNKETPIKMRHQTCGKTYKASPNNILRGSRCHHCYYSNTKTHEEFIKEVNHRLQDYEITGVYTNRRTPIKVLHRMCGEEWDVNPPDFINGSECPYCTVTSFGEVNTTKLLREMKADFTKQKTFPDLKHKGSLSYDFFIPAENVLIEYQGAQHYRPYSFGVNSEQEFKDQIKRDTIKRKYAIENNFLLVEIPYTHRTTEDIDKYLSNYSFYNRLK